MPKSQPDYSSLSNGLADILARLQQPDIAVHEAVTLYEEGLKLVAQLEKHLAEAENTIQKLTLEAEPGK